MSKRASKSKLNPAPERVYLEQWPEAAQRDDALHYEQTGYGDDMRGNTSRMTVYVRDEEQQARLDAIAAIVAEDPALQTCPGEHVDAVRVLATGRPKRSVAAAIRKWSKK